VALALEAEASSIESAVTQLAAAVPSAGAELLDSLRRALTVGVNERVAAHRATIADLRAVAERLLMGDVATWQRVAGELPADQPRPTDPPPVAAAKALRTAIERAAFRALAAPGCEAVLAILEALP
jgi:hypothetical protein